VDTEAQRREDRAEVTRVERAMTDHPAVDRAAVAPVGDPADPQLAGFAVPVPGAAPAGPDLRRHTAGILPAALVPDLFVIVDRLPTTAAGEIDRTALGRASRGNRPGFDDAAVPAIVGGLAAQVADVWREVLKVEHVALPDDLFALGGHSLAITRIIRRIATRTGVTVPLEVFYDTPILAAVVATTERFDDDPNGSEPV
jgi:hypothetical protein